MRRMFVAGIVGAMTLMAVGRPMAAQVADQTRPDRSPRFLYAAVGNAPPTVVDVASVPALRRRISMTLDRVPLKEAVEEIARAGGLHLIYANGVVPVGGPVRLDAREITVAAALMDVLFDAGVDVVLYPGGNMVLTRRTTPKAVLTGIIQGRVTERNTGVPVVSAQVAITGTKLSRYTDDKGQYRIPDVPTGDQEVVVHRVGYEAASRRVRVGDGETAVVDVNMARVATMLSEMVTTATGERSRMEVGNSIGTIKADSLVPTTLIRNMSDLLQARVTGVVVTNSSGRVGAPSKIRIRGITSLVLNNDPIIILDGVRLNWLTSGSKSQTNTGTLSTGSLQVYPAPSRLDDIDPNIIESIDILRGPSAATLYGTEAANGVIVIKTKKGMTGSWQGSVLADDGWSSYPGSYPGLWRGWGRTATGAYTSRCTMLVGSNTTVCQLDSVSGFNGENDPQLTGYGTGTARNLSATLSGGTAQLQQFLSLRASDQVGMSKMAEVEKRRIAQMWGSTLPDWLVHPNAERDFNGSSRTNLRVGQAFDLQATVNGVYRNVRVGQSDDLAYGAGLGATYFGPWDTLAVLQAEGMRRRETSAYKRGFVGTTANFVPIPWMTLTATLGGDYTLRTDEITRRPSDCTVILAPATGCASEHSNERDETFVTTMNLGAQFSFTPRPWLGLRTSIGEQYSGTTFYGLTAGNNTASTNLAFGTDLLTPGPVATSGTPQLYTLTESRDQSATAGFYLEQTFELYQRLYLTGALREDAASAFGPSINRQLPLYPKFSLSWLVSEEPFFPRTPLVSSLRLRAAFGHSGNQARQTDVLPNYQVTTVVLDNTNVPGIVLSQIPNPVLKPERVTEAEGGFDLSLLAGERVHIEGTMYRKLSRDAILSITLPASYASLSRTQRLNIGSVENRGVELSVNTKLLDTRLISWDVGVNYAENHNLLVSSVTPCPGCASGYPLFAIFSRRPGAWSDLNGDGILQRGEVTWASGTPGQALGSYFYGAPYPKSESTLRSSVALFSGIFRIDGVVDRVDDATITDNFNSVFGKCEIAADICTPDQQAVALAYRNSLQQRVSWMRLSELSATYVMPPALVRRTLHARAATLTIAGRNLGLWTNYRYKDPTANTLSDPSGNGGQMGDAGFGVSQPVNWTVRLNLGF